MHVTHIKPSGKKSVIRFILIMTARVQSNSVRFDNIIYCFWKKSLLLTNAELILSKVQ